MSSTTRKGDGTNRFGLETPKVSRVLSTTPVSKDAAFDMIARFLNREKQEYMSTAAGSGSVDETLAASTSAWNGLRRVCNSLLPSHEFNNSNAGEIMGNTTREPVSAWWSETSVEVAPKKRASNSTPMPRTKVEQVAPAAADHDSSSSPSSEGGPKLDKKASKKEKKQAKKEAKKVKKAAKKLAKKAKKEKKDKIKMKQEE